MKDDKIEVKKADALAMFRENPQNVVDSLLQRERNIVAILCSAIEPISAETVRDAYLAMVYTNIELNTRLISLITELDLFALYRQTGNQKLLMVIERKLATMPEAHEIEKISFSKNDKIKMLTKMYHEYNPKRRKVPLVINGMTVQKMLDNMTTFYDNLIETRKTQGGRTIYYINPEFRNMWKDAARKFLALKLNEQLSRQAEAELYNSYFTILVERYRKGLLILRDWIARAKDHKEELIKDRKQLDKLLEELEPVGLENTVMIKPAIPFIKDALMPYDNFVRNYIDDSIEEAERLEEEEHRSDTAELGK